MFIYGVPMSKPPASLRERKRQMTADLLADTAMALFQERGFKVVTMDEIASRAEVARGTLYSYFPVKEALLSHYFGQHLQRSLPDIMAQLAGLTDPLQRLHAFLLGSAVHLESYRDFFGPYLQYRFAHPESPDSGSSRLFLHLLEEARVAGQLRGELAPDVLLDYLRNLVLGALHRWLHSGETLQVEYERMWEFFLHGAARPV